MNDSPQFSTFFMMDLAFAVAVHKVQEVIRHLDITRVPLAPDAVSGLINLRGQIILAINGRRCLELGERTATQPSVHLILRIGDELISLIVDDLGDVMEFEDADRE